MRINKRFAPRNKNHNLSHFQTNQSDSANCPILQPLSPHQFKNSNSLDVKHNPLYSRNQFFQHPRLRDQSSANPLDSIQNKAEGRQPKPTTRKSKLQNLRQSIQSLQQLISKSRQVLNDSSLINYSRDGSMSPKARVKSDSFDVKFNFSTRKVNQRKLEHKIIHLLNSEQSDPQISFRQNLLMDSIQKANQYKAAQINQSTQMSIQSPDGKKGHMQTKYVLQSSNQEAKTGNQLNSTLQKLLNQSFESVGNGGTKWVSSPSTTIMNQSPKWLKDKKQLGRGNQSNKLSLFKKPRVEPSSNNQTSGFQTKQVSFDDMNFQNTTCDEFYQSEQTNPNIWSQMNQNDNNKILIDQSDDIIQEDDGTLMNQIGALTTKSRNQYQGHSPLQDSYARVNKNLFQLKLQLPQKLLIKTPKAYKTYQQNKSDSKDYKLKDWIPKNFVQFQNKVLHQREAPNVFRESSNQGKFSPRVIPFGKQNRKHETLQSKNSQNGFQERENKKKFIYEVCKYPFVERYLKQADIVAMYDKLKKSRVPEQKWILFVIDEVHKKMKQGH